MAESQTREFQVGKAGRLLLGAAPGKLDISYIGPPSHAVFLVLSDNPEIGSGIVPYGQGFEGSTVFLPLLANKIYFLLNNQRFRRIWNGYQWSQRSTECPELRSEVNGVGLHIHLNTAAFERLGLVLYVKDISDNHGWGRLLGSCDPSAPPGIGDKVIRRFCEVSKREGKDAAISSQHRFHAESRERIYELFVRLFSNINERRKQNGTLDENGCGKFNDITDTAIASIAGMGFTHIWLMGVVRHATTTSYESIGLPADDAV
jgi:hypothetical protein